MRDQEALAFVEDHGIVTESARSSVPSLAEEVAGGPISGSWWAHPRHREIFRLTRVVRGSRDVLVCRFADGKVTYVHRRLWPYLVRLASKLDLEALASIREIHTPAGKHVVEEIPYPDWVPHDVMQQAEAISEEEAEAEIERWLHTRSKGFS